MTPADDFAGARVTVYLEASDPISAAGLTAQLLGQPGIVLVDQLSDAATAVLLVDAIDEGAAALIRRLAGERARPVLAIAAVLDDLGMLRAVESGASGMLRRSEATPDRLAGILVSAARGHGSVPPDLLGSLLAQLNKLQRNVLAPKGLLLNGFSEREIEVLRLVADGYGTGEIAEKLSYSERTVKNVIHEVTLRFNLRNRSHAVAYALRAGVL